MKKKLILLALVVLGAIALIGCKIRTFQTVTFENGKIKVHCKTSILAKDIDDSYSDETEKATFLNGLGYDINKVEYHEGDKYYYREADGEGNTYDEAYENSGKAILQRKVKKDEKDNIIRESIFTQDKISFFPEDYMSEVDPSSTDPSVVAYAFSEISFSAPEAYVDSYGGTLSEDKKTITFTLTSDMKKDELAKEYYAYTAAGVCARDGHKTETVNAKPATYFDNGYEGDIVCSVCGENFGEGKTTDKLVLKKTKITKVTPKSSAVTIKWKKVKGATGYNVQIKIGKKWKKASPSKTKYTFKKLNSGKKYKVRVRAFVKKGSKKAFAKWRTKTVKTK